jgi:hypothetical protein
MMKMKCEKKSMMAIIPFLAALAYYILQHHMIPSLHALSYYYACTISFYSFQPH